MGQLSAGYAHALANRHGFAAPYQKPYENLTKPSTSSPRPNGLRKPPPLPPTMLKGSVGELGSMVRLPQHWLSTHTSLSAVPTEGRPTARLPQRPFSPCLDN